MHRVSVARATLSRAVQGRALLSTASRSSASAASGSRAAYLGAAAAAAVAATATWWTLSNQRQPALAAAGAKSTNPLPLEERVAGLELELASNTNRAFVFVKPHAGERRRSSGGALLQQMVKGATST